MFERSGVSKEWEESENGKGEIGLHIHWILCGHCAYYVDIVHTSCTQIL